MFVIWIVPFWVALLILWIEAGPPPKWVQEAEAKREAERKTRETKLRQELLEKELRKTPAQREFDVEVRQAVEDWHTFDHLPDLERNQAREKRGKARAEYWMKRRLKDQMGPWGERPNH